MFLFSDIAALCLKLRPIIFEPPRPKDTKFTLNGIPISVKILKAVQFILRNTVDSKNIECIDLTGCKGFFTIISNHASFFKINNFYNVKSLLLDSCSLKEMPIVENLRHLKTMSVNDNSITQVQRNFRSATLEQLECKGNAIELLDLDPFENVPNLIVLSVGNTKFLGDLVFKKAWHDKHRLQVKVDGKCRCSLIIPLADIIDPLSNVQSKDKKSKNRILSKLIYANYNLIKEVIHISPINNVTDTQKALGLLIHEINPSKCISELNLSDHKDLYTFITHSGLNDILKSKPLFVISRLILSNIGLTAIPSALHYLKCIETLDLSKNLLTTVENIDSNEKLQFLMLQDNPIETITVPENLISTLTRVEFGSTLTKYISDSLVCSNVGLEGSTEEYYQYLILPPAAYLLDVNFRNRYLEDKPSIIKKIHNKDDRKNAYLHVAEVEKDIPTELDFSGDVSIQDRIDSLVNQPNMTVIVKLVLQHCQINCLPSISNLVNIHQLDISRNALENIDSLESESLQWLSVSKNPIPTVHLNAGKVPALTYLECGSEVTQFISLIVLRRVGCRELTVNVIEQFRSSLVLPSWQMLSDQSHSPLQDLLHSCFQKKEINLSYIDNWENRSQA